MSKVKPSLEQRYELLYIIPNNFTEEEAQKIHEKVKENISQKGAEISFEDQWGKKKLAYPIDHFNHGYYNLLEFTALKEKISDIEHFLRFSDEVLRYQVVMKKDSEEPGQVKAAREEKALEEKPEKEEQSEDLSEATDQKEEEKPKEEEKVAGKDSKERSQEELDPKEKDKEEEKKEEEKKRKDDQKVDLNDLDEKLDDILNNNNLV